MHRYSVKRRMRRRSARYSVKRLMHRDRRLAPNNCSNTFKSSDLSPFGSLVLFLGNHLLEEPCDKVCFALSSHWVESVIPVAGAETTVKNILAQCLEFVDYGLVCFTHESAEPYAAGLTG